MAIPQVTSERGTAVTNLLTFGLGPKCTQLKADLWMHFVCKIYEEEIIGSYPLTEDESSMISFPITPLTIPTPSFTKKKLQYAIITLVKL